MNRNGLGRISFWISLVPWILLGCALARVPGFG